MQSETSTLIVRSSCVGIAAAVVTSVAGLFIIGISAAILHPSPSEAPEVGWDVVVNLHDYPAFGLIPLCGFAIGFALGYRYFSKERTPPPSR
jgi:hypothetical protein